MAQKGNALTAPSPGISTFARTLLQIHSKSMSELQLTGWCPLMCLRGQSCCQFRRFLLPLNTRQKHPSTLGIRLPLRAVSPLTLSPSLFWSNLRNPLPPTAVFRVWGGDGGAHEGKETLMISSLYNLTGASIICILKK